MAGDAIRVSIALHEWIEQALRAIHARSVSISHEIALEAYALPSPFHKDPADRFLASHLSASLMATAVPACSASTTDSKLQQQMRECECGRIRI